MNVLTFESFISVPVLIGFYYLGALMIPALLWIKRDRVIKIADTLTRHFRIVSSRLILGFVLLFIGFELVWRMMFEAMIGYFQMREYLQQLAG